MSFAQDNGYTPRTFDEIMGAIRTELNAQFTTSFTEESFVGTRWYQYFYALVQQAVKGEVKTSEVFAKVTEYITETNLRIQRPSVSLPGAIDSFTDNGYTASLKKPSQGEAGQVSVCVDVDNSDPDYATTKLAICNLLKQFFAAGTYFNGTEQETLTLSNGQSFDFAYYLPNYTPILLRVTCAISVNNLLTVPSDEVIRQEVYDQINARYRLGWNFEPSRYYTTDDAPWAASVLVEYSTNDGSSWSSSVATAAFDDLYTFDLEDIQVIVS